MYDQNYLVARLRKSSIGNEEAVFLKNHQTGDSISYGEFFANAERMAAVLVEAGLQTGDRIAVQAPKTQAMLELYIATVMAGGVFLPLNTAYTGTELRYFLGDASPRILICDPSNQQALSLIAQETGVMTVLTLGANEEGTLTERRDQQLPGFTPVARSEKDLASILYTSGTTGRSKGAMITHQGLASNAETLKEVWRFTKADVLIHALPIFHIHGLFVAINITLMAGSSCIFMASFNPKTILDYMKSATVLMGVPTFYVRLLEMDGLSDASKSMRLFISGSAPLLAETHDKWREKTSHAILERYGMTETNMNTSNPYDGDRRAGTVGLPLPDVEVIVTHPESGEILATGEIGVLEVRGANVFAGYWQMPEKTAEELRDNGFFITGDLGMIDADGYIHIVGRGKDLIITGGYNVYPKEIELLIDCLPGVMESAVIGVPHADFGEGVVAVVVAEKSIKINETEILNGLSTDLAKFKQPKKIIFVDELPRNTMGKVQKKALREQYNDLLS